MWPEDTGAQVDTQSLMEKLPMTHAEGRDPEGTERIHRPKEGGGGGGGG